MLLQSEKHQNSVTAMQQEKFSDEEKDFPTTRMKHAHKQQI